MSGLEDVSNIVYFCGSFNGVTTIPRLCLL